MGQMIEISAPDGSIIEFPVGTPEPVIQDAMLRRFGVPVPTAIDPNTLNFDDLIPKPPAAGPGGLDPAALSFDDLIPQKPPLVKPDGTLDTDAFLRTVSPGWTPAAPVAPGPVEVPYDELGGTGAAMQANPMTPYRAPGRTLTDVIRGKPGAGQAGPPERPVTALGVATASLQGADRLLADFIGWPVDAVNNLPRVANLANLIPGVSGIDVGPISPKPFMGSDSIAGAAESVASLFGAKPYEPGNLAERAAYRIGRELGGALLPVGAVLGTAARVGVQGSREMARSPNVVKSLFGSAVEAAAVNPAGVVGREMGTATAAGTGAAIANEIAGNPQRGDNFWSDFAGSLAGVGLMGAVKPVLGAASSAAATAFGSPRFADDVARQTVADRIIDNSRLARDQFDRTGTVDTAEIVAALGRPAAIETTVPGYRADIAERTGDPGLDAFVRNQGASRPGSALSRRSENDAAVADRMTAFEPRGSAGRFRAGLEAGRDVRLADVDAQALEAQRAAEAAREGIYPTMPTQVRGATVRSAVDDALARFIAETEAAQRAAARTAQDSLGALTPQSDPAARGNVIRSSLEAARDTARGATADAYDNADFAGRAVDPTGLTEALDGVSRNLTPAERLLVPQRLIDDTAALGRAGVDAAGQALPVAAMQLKAATDLRSELLRRQRGALADPRAESGGRNAARVIGQYLDATEGFIRHQLSPEEIGATDLARAARFDEAERFGRNGDIISQAVARHDGGRPRVRDERVASLFVDPATGDPLQRLLGMADTPAVRAAIRDEILTGLGAPTKANAAKLERFVQDFEIPLRQFPGLRDEILGAGRAQRAADDAAAAVDTRRSAFNGGSRALADTTARRTDGLPSVADENVAGRFIGTGGARDLDALFARADTPDVRQALEDEILARVAVGSPSPEALRDRVARYAEPLARFPGLQDRVLDAADAQAVERFGRDMATDTRAVLTTPGRSATANYLKYDDARTLDAVRTVTNSAQPERAMRELLDMAGGGAAVDNARSAFWRLLREEGQTAAREGGKRWDGRALTAFLDDPKNSAVAQVLYERDPAELDDMRRVFDALAGSGSGAGRRSASINARTEGLRPSGRGYDAALSTSSIASRVRSVNRGQLSPTIALIDIASTYLRRRSAQMQAGAIERLQDDVIANPGLAARLLEDYNPADFAAKRRMILQRYGVRATQVLNLLDEAHEEERDSVKAAAMR